MAKNRSTTYPGREKPGSSDIASLKLREENRHLASCLQRIIDSPLLNGGFNNLLFKIEKIEESQERIVKKVDSIHEAIYHPDEGLFARVKNVEQMKSDNVEKIEREVFEIQTWKNAASANVDVLEKSAENVELLEKQLDDLIKWKQRLSAATKWFLLTLVGGTITLVGKLLYDFLSGHVKFV